MGLGKTVQLAAFLAGLHQSGLFKPTLIVCPATVLRQWLRELRLWYPLFRVVILHDSSKSSSRIRQSRRWAVLPAGLLHLLRYTACVTHTVLFVLGLSVLCSVCIKVQMVRTTATYEARATWPCPSTGSAAVGARS